MRWSAPAAPRLVYVLPAYHEAAVIASGVAALREQAPPGEIVVVDDGSKDATGAIAAAAGATVLVHALNRGQGAALQTGLSYARRRSLFGSQGAGIPSRFLGEIPDHLVERHSAAPATTGWGDGGSFGGGFVLCQTMNWNVSNAGSNASCQRPSRL